MLILTLRTDKPEAEIGLYDDSRQLAYTSWEAHRKLAESIHAELKSVLDGQGKNIKDLQGIVIYKGPGSFTGLRIGFSVTNALADSIQIPIVSNLDESWIAEGIERLQANQNEKIAQPEYGSPARTTIQKK